LLKKRQINFIKKGDIREHSCKAISRAHFLATKLKSRGLSKKPERLRPKPLKPHHQLKTKTPDPSAAVLNLIA
jgi:hypothetical protein